MLQKLTTQEENIEIIFWQRLQFYFPVTRFLFR